MRSLRPFFFLVACLALAGCAAHTRVGFLNDQTNRKLLELTKGEAFVWKDASGVFAVGSDSKDAVATLSNAGYNCNTVAFEINCSRRIGSFALLHEELLNVRFIVDSKYSISKATVRHIGVGP